MSQRPARTLLTALGTILGVGAFVATTVLADTARAQVSSRFDALKATEVRVEDGLQDGTNPFPEDVDARLERLNGINHAGLFYSVESSALQPRNTATRPLGSVTPIPVIAATPGAIQASRPTLQMGRVYDSFVQQRGLPVAVLGRVAAEQLGVARIDNQPVIFLNDHPFTVVGIVDDVQRNPDLLLSITIPPTAEQRYLRNEEIQPTVIIDTDPGAAPLAGRQAPIALLPNNPERLTALVPPDPQSLRNNVDSDVTSLYYALAGLALMIGTIAIANATLLNTIERRPEIGLRRALGATRGQIARQITAEAAMVGALAGITGTSLAVTAMSIFSYSREWTLVINPTIVLVAPLIGLATGALAGFAPALRAANTPPATTLRT